ncbi:MAG: hypothetical protein HUU35_04130, partial [Armatimonadetes bacterium]|nr:hypothetical protein [Armatimonadota bacterium]
MVISSPSNELVKRARALRTRKGRERTGMFVVEGSRAIATVVAAGAAVDVVLTVPDFDEPRLARLPVRRETITAELLATLTDEVSPPGCLALVASP